MNLKSDTRHHFSSFYYTIILVFVLAWVLFGVFVSRTLFPSLSFSVLYSAWGWVGVWVGVGVGVARRAREITNHIFSILQTFFAVASASSM